MSARERLVGWWKGAARSLHALASAAEFDPHEVTRQRLMAIEDRLRALEQAPGRSAVGANAGAGLDRSRHRA